jgi:hypothetical protein
MQYKITRSGFLKILGAALVTPLLARIKIPREQTPAWEQGVSAADGSIQNSQDLGNSITWEPILDVWHDNDGTYMLDRSGIYYFCPADFEINTWFRCDPTLDLWLRHRESLRARAMCYMADAANCCASGQIRMAVIFRETAERLGKLRDSLWTNCPMLEQEEGEYYEL